VGILGGGSRDPILSDEEKVCRELMNEFPVSSLLFSALFSTRHGTERMER
jgi:hypothetical protein